MLLVLKPTLVSMKHLLCAKWYVLIQAKRRETLDGRLSAYLHFC